MRQILIGIDGGGTGCRARVGTLAEGVLGQASGGPANATSDRNGAIQSVLDVARQAMKVAGLSLDEYAGAVAHVGLAGVMTPQQETQIAQAMPFARVNVTDDKPTTIAGALGRNDGFVLSVGTGTLTAVQQTGNIRSVGGWGLAVSDHGSGAWLGRGLLEQVLWCHDGLAAFGDLTRTTFQRFDDDPNKVVAFCATARPADYADFAPDIIAAAQGADPAGHALMTQGAAVMMRGLAALGYQGRDPLCLMGGIGDQYAVYIGADNVIAPAGTALDGAYQLAQRL